MRITADAAGKRPKVVPVQICFTPVGLKALDRAAKRAGVLSRSQFVRLAVSAYLAQPDEPTEQQA